MVTSNFAWFAYDFGVADVRVWGMAALPLALTIDRLMNGFTRPFFGWVSDRIGRENTMGLSPFSWRRRRSCCCWSFAATPSPRRGCPASSSSVGARYSRCFPRP